MLPRLRPSLPSPILAFLCPRPAPAIVMHQPHDERPQQRQEADGSFASGALRRSVAQSLTPRPSSSSARRPSASSPTRSRSSTSSPTRTRSRSSSTPSSTLARVRTRPALARRAPSAARPSTSRPSAASTRPSRSSPSVSASRRSATSRASPSAVRRSSCSTRLPARRDSPAPRADLLDLFVMHSCRRAHQRCQGLVELVRHQEEGVRLPVPSPSTDPARR